jgi:hypothetical protein
MGAVDSVRAPDRGLRAFVLSSGFACGRRAAPVEPYAARQIGSQCRDPAAADRMVGRAAEFSDPPGGNRKALRQRQPVELAILAQASAQTEPGSEIIEIGTFDGRTTLNIAVNAPEHTPVVTLDLPDNHPTRYELEASERRLVEKPASGGSASAPAGRRGAATPAASPRCSEIPRALTGRRTTAWPGSCSSTARMPTTTPARTPRRRFGW